MEVVICDHKHLVRPVEDVGVIVVLEDFGIPKLDGVSVFSNKRTPMIFLNLQAPPSRRRFSIAHELAHTVLHRNLSPDVDEQADALAAEILMPEDEIALELADGPLTLARLADLKLRWRVSMAALLYRAKTLKLIDPRRYTYLWTQMSQSGYRIREPHEELFDNEAPSLERELIQFHREDLEYSDAEIAESLDIPCEEVNKRYNAEFKFTVI
jgi:Zn-dependent peptidase ImmA (M78 family)